ncbi:hypothetical protein N4239_12490 [Brachyspira hyodysenteriae]|uniref:hypothetical protein n=1 Tax=Brachyspira hyodysenteriae TaxID=159 RepID=UPI002B262568|nr:hypothetical protein [Brachyspira hyodysenteriae]WPC23751.1 hypothetical protein N4239_12490 [Brachyspira hyodysenteriae]
MATTHVLIVDDNTFKYHLEYMFIGTGSKDNDYLFNNPEVKEKPTTERLMISMLSDLNRVKIGDYVIFYLQQKDDREGRFYGIFKISSIPFIDAKGEYLFNYLNKKLTFRALIEPYEIYAEGVTEWEALDDIKNIQSPCQMLWSLIYRKLKGNRGNTMITIYETERLFSLIRNKNNNNFLDNNSGFSFDRGNIVNSKAKKYLGKKESINIIDRLLYKYNKKQAFEVHLQSYILQKFNDDNFLSCIMSKEYYENYIVEWIGNEVSCGVGMQRIDIMISLINKSDNTKRVIMPIELKDEEIDCEKITKQLERYINWISQYYIPNRISSIKPVIIGKHMKNDDKLNKLLNVLKKFNETTDNNCYNVVYIEFIINNNEIIFKEVEY